ncbi:CBS domain-containing protein [Nonomuraea roseoviolacea]|uniref:CBS domain-containing protein n=1 Tax=Nonomuraea roseoviolacea subsp. carminata TaxID=160689 RepID=A0ABT1JSK2_9ACTN|nr:CBS domain-containing protein [Nonomuraea roseoviolacea]MCP2344729.1 CBS domain-containing protein [Nonomuraea roseoviolacea subsp. carminata]
MSITVKDVMGRMAVAVREDASFSDIITAMRLGGVGAVTVIDADRRPVGVVSEDDLLLKEAGDGRTGLPFLGAARRRREHEKAAGATAAQLMTAPAVTVTPGTPVRDAARSMRDRRIKQLPVIDPVTGRVIGALHQRDVLAVFTRPAAELEADVLAALPDPADAGGELSVEIDRGVVTIRGRVGSVSQAAATAEALRAVDGVVDVVSELDVAPEDRLIVPPLL